MVRTVDIRISSQSQNIVEYSGDENKDFLSPGFFVYIYHKILITNIKRYVWQSVRRTTFKSWE